MTDAWWSAREACRRDPGRRRRVGGGRRRRSPTPIRPPLAAGSGVDGARVQAARTMSSRLGALDHHWRGRQRLYLQRAAHGVVRSYRAGRHGGDLRADPVRTGLLSGVFAGQLSQPLVHGGSQHHPRTDAGADQGRVGSAFHADHDHDRDRSVRLVRAGGARGGDPGLRQWWHGTGVRSRHAEWSELSRFAVPARVGLHQPTGHRRFCARLPAARRQRQCWRRCGGARSGPVRRAVHRHGRHL